VKASENEARAKAETAKVEAAQYTLKALLTDYCDHLEALGRVSHREARSILTLHVTKAWPKIAALSAWAKEVPHRIEDFQAKRIRSGVETLLTSAKVSSDIRGRLQSRGISGVQARHYDGYDYDPKSAKPLKFC